MGNIAIQTTNETCLSREADRAGHRYWAEFEDRPFAEGVSRYAYRGVLHGDGAKAGQQCVVKVFKDEYARSSAQWTVDIATAKRSQELAEAWNRTTPTTKPAHFRIPIIAKMDKHSASNSLEVAMLQVFLGGTPTTINIGPNEYVAMEDFIYGMYEKFNSNKGWVNEDGHNFAPAFSHYTWWKTGGQEMVCDLQRVRMADSYELTDPAIHSQRQLYGVTDLGREGMDYFFSTHRCNSLCQGLPVPRVDPRWRHFTPRRNTAYVFE